MLLLVSLVLSGVVLAVDGGLWCCRGWWCWLVVMVLCCLVVIAEAMVAALEEVVSVAKAVLAASSRPVRVGFGRQRRASSSWVVWRGSRASVKKRRSLLPSALVGDGARRGAR